jgi:GT2 family glycosyltransferase
MTLHVIVPTRFPDLIDRFVDSLWENETGDYSLIVVVNGPETNNWSISRARTVYYPDESFVFSKAINMGLSVCALDSGNVILVNDDCVVIEPDTFQRLDSIGSSKPGIGILSPLIKGFVGNPSQRWWEKDLHWEHGQKINTVHGNMPVCFPCVWVSRSLINEIGGLNEEIRGYGHEDNEYCLRARKAGYVTAVTSEVVIQHGDGSCVRERGKTWSLSFNRIFKQQRGNV